MGGASKEQELRDQKRLMEKSKMLEQKRLAAKNAEIALIASEKEIKFKDSMSLDDAMRLKEMHEVVNAAKLEVNTIEKKLENEEEAAKQRLFELEQKHLIFEKALAEKIAAEEEAEEAISAEERRVLYKASVNRLTKNWFIRNKDDVKKSRGNSQQKGKMFEKVENKGNINNLLDLFRSSKRK